MKKTFFIFLLVAASLTATANDKPSLLKKAVQMERLRKAGHLLEAMDTATLILTCDRDYRAAVDFVHQYWDKTMRLTDEQLQLLSDDESLEQAEQRCEIYRVLDEIHDNLRSVRMPLYGPNQKWVWQPEVGYYTGHYDNERQKTFRMLMHKAQEALAAFDAESAKLYYELALQKYLITDGERRSNKGEMLRQCNSMAVKYAKSQKIYDAIFAYDLCSISLAIEPEQESVTERQQQIQAHVAELYLQAAEEAQQAGDTLQAYELRLAHEEWK